MFEIKPIESKERQKAICAQCGVPYRDDCFASFFSICTCDFVR